MIKLAADLHIHSCLSPCGDMDMTPNNLVNMSYIKGLDAIAVCDHNTTGNLPACKAVADECGILFIPGMELETREEVHMLCLFPELDAAMEFGKWVYPYLPDVLNQADFFGPQVVMNKDDEPIDTEPKLLIQSTLLSINEAAEQCRSFGGVPVPAHINRTSNSVLCNLGFIPDDLAFTSVEIYPGIPVNGVDLSRYHIVCSSDAHNLMNILEPEHFISAYDKSVQGILQYLAEPK